MKRKIKTLSILLISLMLLTGCGSTKTMECTTTEKSDGKITESNLSVRVKKDNIEDMTLALNITLPEEQQSYKQLIITQMKQKTPQVYATNNGIRAIFDMNSSYFEALGVSSSSSFSEIKQVLELQGYSCKTK